MPQLKDFKNLYSVCFSEDSKEDMEFLFKSFLKNADILHIDKGGLPISMLFLVDSNLVYGGSKYPVYYLYAACTHPNYRGAGHMRDLLKKAAETAKAKSKAGIFLKPANERLYSFYKKSGYVNFFYEDTVDLSLKDIKAKGTARDPYFKRLNSKEWLSLRADLIKDANIPYAEFGKQSYTDLMKQYNIICDDNEDYLVYEVLGSSLNVKEAFCKKSADALLHFTAHTALKENCKSATLHMPPKSLSDFSDNAELKCSGMFYSTGKYHGLISPDAIKNVYLGYAWD